MCFMYVAAKLTHSLKYCIICLINLYLIYVINYSHNFISDAENNVHYFLLSCDFYVIYNISRKCYNETTISIAHHFQNFS